VVRASYNALDDRLQTKYNFSASWIAVARNSATGRVEWHAQVTTCTLMTSHDGSAGHRSDNNSEFRVAGILSKTQDPFPPKMGLHITVLNFPLC